MTEPVAAKAGDVLHVLVSGLTVDGKVWCRGDQITITEDLLASTRDTRGVSWLDDLSEDAQTRRWRRPMLAVGPKPADLETWVHGDPQWEEARERARREAWVLPESLRPSALAEVERRFGPMATTSAVHNAAPDPSVRLAEQQEAARRVEGLKQFIAYEPSRREV